MKIAVTYEDGNVFPHFGHTAQFKVFEVNDGVIVSESLISPNGEGHDALAAFLFENSVNVLICGGIGDGAQAALESFGIEICSGAEGPADRAVKAYLTGELVSAGVNCDHHRGADLTEEDSEASGCGGGCSGCGGGCSGCGDGCHSLPDITGPNVGKTCRTHYVGSFNDGTVFDSSYDRGEPLEFTCGAGMMIRGFDEAVANMRVGELKDIHLMPSEAYGEYDPSAVFSAEIAQMPGTEGLSVGQQVYLQDFYGRPIPVTVIGKDATTITFDANHEMAGKELNFRIELISVDSSDNAR